MRGPLTPPPAPDPPLPPPHPHLIPPPLSSPQTTDESLVAVFEHDHASHASLAKAAWRKGEPISKTRFAIAHYAGTVEYDASGFLTKNAGALAGEMEVLLKGSSMACISAVGAATAEESGIADGAAAPPKENAPPTPAKKGRGRRQSVAGGGGKKKGLAGAFTRQLEALVLTLRQTTPHYVRCVKPNAKQAPAAFEPSFVLHQLRCGGTPQLLTLMGRGFPTRCAFDALATRYQPLLPALGASLAPREFVDALLSALEMRAATATRPPAVTASADELSELGAPPDEAPPPPPPPADGAAAPEAGAAEEEPAADYALGVRYAFFSAGAMATLDALLHGTPEEAEALTEKVRRFITRRRWRRAAATVKATLRLQRTVVARRNLDALARRAFGLVALRRGAMPWLARCRTTLRRAAAAVSLQAAARGVAARRPYLRTRAATVVVQTGARALLARKAVATRRAEAAAAAAAEAAAANALQRAARAFIAYRRDGAYRKRVAAAATLGRCARGYAGRRAAAAKRAERARAEAAAAAAERAAAAKAAAARAAAALVDAAGRARVPREQGGGGAARRGWRRRPRRRRRARRSARRRRSAIARRRAPPRSRRRRRRGCSARGACAPPSARRRRRGGRWRPKSRRRRRRGATGPRAQRSGCASRARRRRCSARRAPSWRAARSAAAATRSSPPNRGAPPTTPRARSRGAARAHAAPVRAEAPVRGARGGGHPRGGGAARRGGTSQAARARPCASAVQGGRCRCRGRGGGRRRVGDPAATGGGGAPPGALPCAAARAAEAVMAAKLAASEAKMAAAAMEAEKLRKQERADQTELGAILEAADALTADVEAKERAHVQEKEALMRQVAEAKQEAEARRQSAEFARAEAEAAAEACHRRRQGGGGGQGERARGEDAARARARRRRRAAPPHAAEAGDDAGVGAPLRDQGPAPLPRVASLTKPSPRASPRAPGSKSPRASAATPRSAMIQCSPLVAKSPRVRDTSGFARGMTPGRVGTAAFAPPTPKSRKMERTFSSPAVMQPTPGSRRKSIYGAVSSAVSGALGRMTPGRLSIRNRPSLGGGALASSLSFPTMSSPPLPPPPSDAPGGPDHDKRPKVIRSNKSNLPRPGHSRSTGRRRSRRRRAADASRSCRGRAPRSSPAAPPPSRSRCPSSVRRRRRARAIPEATIVVEHPPAPAAAAKAVAIAPGLEVVAAPPPMRKLVSPKVRVPEKAKLHSVLEAKSPLANKTNGVAAAMPEVVGVEFVEHSI